MSNNSMDWDEVDFHFDFLEENETGKKSLEGFYKVVIADDDEDVHTISKMILDQFEFEGKGLEIIDTYSGKETKIVLEQNPDTAVLFLDVVMEESHSGLEVVDYVRNQLKNNKVRIILRTGQPGEAPEERIIKDYDINDYRLKTELTLLRLKTTLYSTLRNYRDLVTIENSKKGLERIIEASADLFRHNTLTEFLKAILYQMSSLYSPGQEMVFIQEKHHEPTEDLTKSGLILQHNGAKQVVIAGTGKYEDYVGKDVQKIDVFENIAQWIANESNKDMELDYIGTGYIIRKGNGKLKNYIFIEGEREKYDFDIIKVFLANYSLALDNFLLNNLLNETQEEIIFALSEVIEQHFDDTSGHIKRISIMMERFASVIGMSPIETELIRIASTMHDVGKIGIPDAILKKPGKLTYEEFEVMKTHSVIGNTILGKSRLELLVTASEIALRHHEKYDGTGYPDGLKGEEIPVHSRMMAIVDVYDALTHKRCYKDAFSEDLATTFLQENSGKAFDPYLIEQFIANKEMITNGMV